MARLIRSQFARVGHRVRMLQSPGVGSVQDVIAIGPSSASTTGLDAHQRWRLDQAVATLRAAMRDQQLGAW